jgi:Secretion system C-terminal sorting domain
MKKFYFLSLLFVGSLSFGQVFTFSGTGVLTSNGWTTHSGTTGQQTILTTPSDSGNSLFKTGLVASTGNRTSVIAGNSEDVNIPITSPITSGTIYYSVLVKVLDAVTLNVNSGIGDYSLALTSVASATTTTFQARVYMKQGSNPGSFAIGVLNNSGGTAAPSYSSTELPINVTHLLVVKYDLATNTASLLINPTPGTEPAASSTNVTGTTVSPTQIAGFVIRQGGTLTAGTGNVEIDEIKIGNTFSSVVQSNLSIAQNQISGLNVYPNPVTNGKLSITSDSNESKAVVIYDILGKQVLSTVVTNQVVNVSDLTSGVYVIKITEEGKTATRKLVIR